MQRGADSRVGKSVKKRPHLLNDLARAKGKRLIQAYEKNPYPKSKSPYPKFPMQKALHAVDLATTGGAGQMISDRLHGKSLSTEQKLALGALAGGGGLGKNFSHPGIGPRKIGGIYQGAYGATPYKVLDIKPVGEQGFAIQVVNLPSKENPGHRIHEIRPRWHSTWWDEHKDVVLHDPDEPRGPAPLQTQQDPPVYAPRSMGDSADPMVRALNRLSMQSPNNVAQLLIQAGSPIRRLLDAKLGAKPIHSTGALMDTHGGFPRRRYTEAHVLKGTQSHLPFVPGDRVYGAQRFRPLSPERRAALNRILFEHLYSTRN